jgi:hypothetical protein
MTNLTQKTIQRSIKATALIVSTICTLGALTTTASAHDSRNDHRYEHRYDNQHDSRYDNRHYSTAYYDPRRAIHVEYYRDDLGKLFAGALIGGILHEIIEEGYYREYRPRSYKARHGLKVRKWRRIKSSMKRKMAYARYIEARQHKYANIRSQHKIYKAGYKKEKHEEKHQVKNARDYNKSWKVNHDKDGKRHSR